MTRNIVGFLRAAIFAVLFLAASLAPASAQFADQKIWGGTSGGSANVQTLTIPNMPSAYPVGVPFRFIAGFTNTTTTTLNISGKGAIAIYKPTGAGAVALSGGELIVGQVAEVVYNGAQFQIISSTDAAASQIKVTPQGYLTPCPVSSPPTGCVAGQLAPTADVTVGVAQPVTGLVYTPAVGNQIPIYNGSNMVALSFSELTLTLASSHLANVIYDVCVFNDSGTIRAVTGPAWSTSTIGSGARGSGAGTAQITRVQGIWTNAVSITGLNGATTYPVAANQCTIVGTIMMSGANGVMTFNVTVGVSRRWPAFNFYNRLPIVLNIQEPTASWSLSSGTIAPLNANANNNAIMLLGLQDQPTFSENSQGMQCTSASDVKSGIGWNSSTAFSGLVGRGGSITQVVGWYAAPPTLGANQTFSLGQLFAGSACTTLGGQAQMTTVKYGG